MLPAGSLEAESLHFQTTGWHYTTSCNTQSSTPEDGEIITRNMLRWLELLINHYCCIWLVVYIIYVLHLRLHTCETISCISPLVKECDVECTAVWNSTDMFPHLLTASNRHRWVSSSHCHHITPAPTQKEAGDNPQSQFGNKGEEKNACHLDHSQSQ